MAGKKKVINLPGFFIGLILVAIGIIYYHTLLPTVGFWDTGEFQTIPFSFDIAHPPGYPTYLVLGRLFYHLVPLGKIAWRMNLFAMVSMILSLYLLAKTIYLITHNTLYSVIILPILALLSPLFWQMALFADPHSLHLLLTALSIYLLIKAVKKKEQNILILVTFICGISLGNHLLSIFTLPALLISSLNFLLMIKRSVKLFIALFISFILGCSIYLTIWFIGINKPALTSDYQVNNWQNFTRYVLGTDFKFQMGNWTKGNFPNTLKYYLDFVNENIPVFLILFSIAGILWLIKTNKPVALILLITNILNVIFTLRFQNGFLERYFLFHIWSLALFAGLGMFGVASILSIKSKIVQRIYLSGMLVWIGLILMQKIPLNYQKNDQSNNWSAYNYANDVLNTVAPNSYYFTWWSYATPIWYLQKVEGIGQNINVINLSKTAWNESIYQLLIDGKLVYMNEIPDDMKDQLFKVKKTGSIYQAFLL